MRGLEVEVKSWNIWKTLCIGTKVLLEWKIKEYKKGNIMVVFWKIISLHKFHYWNKMKNSWNSNWLKYKKLRNKSSKTQSTLIILKK